MAQATTYDDASETREHVQVIRLKLDEIHSWYEENLKRPIQSDGSSRHHSSHSCDAGNFALYEDRGSYSEAQVIVCPHAKFEDLWTNDSKSRADILRRNIFKCGCSSTAGSHNLQYTRKLIKSRVSYCFSGLIYLSVTIQSLCSGDW